jgi:hypothetical protein
MGMGLSFKCNTCGYAHDTWHNNEFYRDSAGQMKGYAHPRPVSEEARRSGIWGFFDSLYCPSCRKLQVVVTVEFKKPRDYHSAWGWQFGPKDDLMEYDKKCPECGGVDLADWIEEPRPLQYRELPCPKCSNGKLLMVNEWQS